MSIVKKLKAIRGAVCCEDCEEDITSSVIELYERILKENTILEKDIVSIQFTVTDDIEALNPATALRKKGLAENIPLFCSLEPKIKGALSKTIRTLLYCYSRKQVKHIYINGAEVLRPDLCIKR